MNKVIVLALSALIAVVATSAVSQEPPAAPEPSAARWESQHAMVLNGETVEYDAVVGSIILRDPNEKATGELFYTAYFRTNGQRPAIRPIIFSYNGGPGSASFWLHMGIMGLRRVMILNVGQ